MMAVLPILVVLLLGSSVATAAEPPFIGAAKQQQTLQWASQPTMPGQTLLLWGGSLGEVSSVTITPLLPLTSGSSGGGGGGDGGLITTASDDDAAEAISVPTFDTSDTSLKATLPGSLPKGAWRVCVSVEACIIVNGPDPWWWRANTNLTFATPGGWVRVFGRLRDEASQLPSPSLELNSSGGLPAIVLRPANCSANAAWYKLPVGIAVGRYSLRLTAPGVAVPLEGMLSVESADKSARGPTIEVQMCPPHAINANCGKTALFDALNATRAAGGGTILLKQGVWHFTTETIDLPPFTTLRGVDTARVLLVWNTEGVALTAVPKYFVGGNATFAIEDLSISCTRFYRNVITDGNRRVSDPWVPCQGDAVPNCDDDSPVAWSHSRGVRIRRVRIRADCFYRLTERGGPARRGLSANFTYEDVGAAIQLNGQEYEVTDCDIYASMHGIYLGHNQGSLFNSASVGIVARNRFNFGGDCYQIDASSYVIFEQNHCIGINLFSRGSAAGSTYGGPAASFIYFAGNDIRFVFGGDQEELTLDGGFSPYFGGVKSSGNEMIFPRDPVYPQWCSPPGHCRNLDTNWTGAAAYVLGGASQGQLRVFKKGGLAEGLNRTWELQAAFSPPLAADSFVSVFERREKCIYRDNLFSDGGPMQLYGGMWHAVVANNTILRAQGLLVEGLNHGRAPEFAYMPCYFIETISNTITEAITYSGSVSGISASGYYNHTSPFTGAMAAALVYRSNHVDNGKWTVNGAVTDVLIEGNTMQNTQPWNNFSIRLAKLPNGSGVDRAERIFLRNNLGMQ
jgi:hypothetical protein